MKWVNSKEINYKNTHIEGVLYNKTLKKYKTNYYHVPYNYCFGIFDNIDDAEKAYIEKKEELIRNLKNKWFHFII